MLTIGPNFTKMLMVAVLVEAVVMRSDQRSRYLLIIQSPWTDWNAVFAMCRPMTHRKLLQAPCANMPQFHYQSYFDLNFPSLLRDHIDAEVVNNLDGGYQDAPKIRNLLSIEVDDYDPKPDDRWDPEQWEDRKAFLYGPATRAMWKFMYGVARKLVKSGKAEILAANGVALVELGDRPVLVFS